MAGQKFWAHGATITFDSNDVGGVMNISGPSETAEEVDITDNDSSGVREFVKGMRDSGTLNLECHYIAGDVGQAALRTNYETASSQDNTKEVVITAPSGASDSSEVLTLTFDAYVQDITNEFPQTGNESAKRTFVLRVSGGVTEAFA